ncbi:MAG: hypothetical protein IJE68_06180 [Clostridia bacterium]|nr:hypothetical protein [Clostridia bacterium]
MSEKRCKLCNKPYEHHYALFGRGCLENIYELLNFSKPSRIIWNKEMYLCTRIAWKNHKFFLNKKKKYALAQKYIGLNYLNKMNLDFLDDVKEKILKDIKNISIFSKNIKENISFALNDVYKLYNYSQRFDEIIEEFQNIKFEELDEKMAKNFIESLSFIFDKSKISNPISYAVFYSMQYTFWQVVIVGGLLANMKLSAKLLNNSLSPFGKEPSDLIIDDNETITSIIESEAFNKKINELIEKYGQDGRFVLNDYKNRDLLIRFANSDLLYALHDATMFVNAVKNEDNTWNLEIEINDTYDFTDFKNLKEYVDSNETGKDILKDIFSTVLNNLGVVSSEYGVLKIFEVKIKFDYTTEKKNMYKN